MSAPDPRPSPEPAGKPRRDKSVGFKCKGCGATMTWDPGALALSCEYCGGNQQVEDDGAAIEEYRLEDAGEHATGLGLEVRASRCENCGAKVAFDESSTAERCVFCGSASVLLEEARRNAIRPESLVPLGVGQDMVRQEFGRWIKGLWFRPNALKKLKKFDAVGVYLPFWTFDCAVLSHWTAQAGYHYYVTESYTTMERGRPVQRTRQVQHTRWEPAAGQRYDQYDDHRVLGSQGVSAELSARLGEYDTSKLVPYRPDYLAGWLAEEYAVDLEQGWETARGHIEASQRARCAGDVPGDTHRALAVSNRIGDVRWKHVLLPMWSLTYQFGGKSYPVLVHGQTGKVVGKAPHSGIKIFLLVLFIVAVIAVIVVLANAS